MASLYINNSIPLNVCKRKCIKKKNTLVGVKSVFPKGGEAYGTLEGLLNSF